jgi:hypothetical protein
MQSSSDHPIIRSSDIDGPSPNSGLMESRLHLQAIVRLIVWALGALLFITGCWHVMELSSAMLPSHWGLKEVELWLRLLVSPLQMGLGVGLLLRPQMRWLNVAALVLFVLFTFYQTVHWWIDGSPCDCLVVAKVAPIWMWILDLVAILSFAVHLRLLRRASRPNRGLSIFTLFAISAAIFVLIVVVNNLGPRWFKGMQRLDLVRGSDLLKSIPADGTHQLRYVTIRNRTSQKVTLSGGTAHCACTVLNGLPVTIQPWESASIPVLVRATRAAESSRVRVEFFTDFERQPKLAGELFFRSVPVQKETSS